MYCTHFVFCAEFSHHKLDLLWSLENPLQMVISPGSPAQYAMKVTVVVRSGQALLQVAGASLASPRRCPPC